MLRGGHVLASREGVTPRNPSLGVVHGLAWGELVDHGAGKLGVGSALAVVEWAPRRRQVGSRS